MSDRNAAIRLIKLYGQDGVKEWKKEAYACIEQDGYSAQFIYRPPIYDGPLALNASVGYKFAEVPRILNDLWVLNLRCTLA